jgi:hypothetical protein
MCMIIALIDFPVLYKVKNKIQLNVYKFLLDKIKFPLIKHKKPYLPSFPPQ